MSLVAQGSVVLTLILSVIILFVIVGLVVQRFSFGPGTVFVQVSPFLYEYYREVGFLIALTATIGSLYFSTVLGWTPCRLCWYQRILMYPLVVILGVGVIFDRQDVRDYGLPLAMTGGIVALYHYTVQMSPIHSSGCSVTGVSCGTQYLKEFGFVTVPFMALIAFLAITVLLWKFSDEI